MPANNNVNPAGLDDSVDIADLRGIAILAGSVRGRHPPSVIRFLCMINECLYWMGSLLNNELNLDDIDVDSMGRMTAGILQMATISGIVSNLIQQQRYSGFVHDKSTYSFKHTSSLVRLLTTTIDMD